MINRIVFISLLFCGVISLALGNLEGCLHIERSRDGIDHLVVHNEDADFECTEVMQTKSIGVGDACQNIDISTRSLQHHQLSIKLVKAPHLLGPKFLYARLYSSRNCRDFISRGVVDIYARRSSHLKQLKNHRDFSLTELARMKKEETGKLSECIYMKGPRENGTKVLLFNYRDWKVLPHHYNQEGTCRRVIHTDSVKVNGVCSNLDFHPDNIERFRECVAKFPDKKSKQYRMCIWTPDVVSRGGLVDTVRAWRGSTVKVELFDHPDCVKRLIKGKIVVRSD